MRKIMLLVAVLAIASIGGMACSSDSKTSTSSTSSSSGSSSSASGSAPVALTGAVTDKGTGDATSGSLDVELDDFYFTPTFIKVNPGQKVTLHLKNEGTATHTFTSAALGVDQSLNAGEDKDVTITAPASGAAQFHCNFHQSGGMQGATFEKEGDTIGGAAPVSSSSSSSPYTYN